MIRDDKRVRKDKKGAPTYFNLLNILFAISFYFKHFTCYIVHVRTEIDKKNEFIYELFRYLNSFLSAINIIVPLNMSCYATEGVSLLGVICLSLV